jgi:hypothetical protein
MIKLGALILSILKLTLLGCISLLCLAIVYGTAMLIFYSDARQELLWALHWEERPRFGWVEEDPNYFELTNEHNAISGWVADCAKIDDFNFSKASRRTQSLLGLTPPMAATRYQRGSATEATLEARPLPKTVLQPPSDQASEPGRSLNRAETAVLTLSISLTNQRYSQRVKAQDAYMLWQLGSVIIVALGMITTILVSLSSTEFGRGDGKAQRIIRVLAIVFPALGTAAAAVVAFYGAQAEWNQASRSLASLTQLHGQMVWGVARTKCNENPSEDDPIFALIDDWSRRFQDILTVANAASQGNSATSPGVSPGPNQGTNPGATQPPTGLSRGAKP